MFFKKKSQYKYWQKERKREREKEIKRKREKEKREKEKKSERAKVIKVILKVYSILWDSSLPTQPYWALLRYYRIITKLLFKINEKKITIFTLLQYPSAKKKT